VAAFTTVLEDAGFYAAEDDAQHKPILALIHDRQSVPAAAMTAFRAKLCDAIEAHAAQSLADELHRAGAASGDALAAAPGVGRHAGLASKLAAAPGIAWAHFDGEDASAVTRWIQRIATL
jgi:hypothetical protein